MVIEARLESSEQLLDVAANRAPMAGLEPDSATAVSAREQLLLGRQHLARSAYMQAVSVLEAGLDQRHLLTRDEQRQFLLNLCKGYFAINRFEPLAALAAELLRMAADAGDPPFEIEVHALLGSLNIGLGVMDTALEHFDKGLQIANAAAMPQPAHLLFGLGRYYYAMGADDSALHYFQAALRRAVSESDRRMEGTVLNNIGILYSNKRQYDHAARHYQQALKTSRECQDSWTMTLQCNNLAVDLMDQKRFASARRYLRLALHFQALSPSASRESLVKGNLGEIAQLTGKLDVARVYLHEALDLAEQSKDSRRIQERYEDLSKFYEDTGDAVNALKYYKLFHRHNIQFVASTASVRSNLLQNKVELERLRQEQEIHRLKNVELAAAVHQLEHLSQRDGLTGLHNRRAFDAQLRRSIDEHQSGRRSFCVVLADIDDFKHINDSHSHIVGDDVLKTVGSIFAGALRATDFVARYGGEEFAVLLANSTLANARLVCERIRQRVASHPWQQMHNGLGVTISMGLADSLSHDPDAILSAADAKLYLAKRGGKNRVAC